MSAQALQMPLAVWYQGRLAALVTNEGPAVLRPHIAVLEEDHPVRRFVRVMSVDAAMVIDGESPGPFESERAEKVARESLISPADVAGNGHLDDAVLAERCNVPLEQITLRRRELSTPAAVVRALLNRVGL